MVTNEIFTRVFRIAVDSVNGTAFTMEHNETQFLVTAKHLFDHLNHPHNFTIRLLASSGYQSYNVDIRYPPSATVDIAVMKLNPYQPLSSFFDNLNTTSGLTYGQDVYFLGFPYNYDSILQTLPGETSPVPFVKKACMSSIIRSNNDILLLLDGHNNPGFSGGPVCFRSSDQQPMTIAGVISGYRYSKQPIVDNNDQAQQYYWKENTGIIYAYSIKHAVDIVIGWT